MPETAARWAVLMEAKKDGAATQWVVYPPDHQGGMRFMKRAKSRPEHRAKWSWDTLASWAAGRSKLEDQLAAYERAGWRLMTPLVIRLDFDDFETAWKTNPGTPYKALRHFAKQADRQNREL